ncbi:MULTISPECIES: DNA-binding protein [unclassified Legionella]|uniref:DNA-binding protein n=1 Tax=unclassified Legionella TaxID=2622702 RepID=UPI001054EE0A|nr:MULTISPECIES: DNA-binding protein [unclassified Legionella]MDI9819762.1 DNA-binding protein [Legionella sp. PL877]
MTLDNLIGISLEKIPSNPDAIKRLLHAAERNIVDSKIDLVSAENRFDAAYKAIMQLANAALQAHGYRTLTSKPGHHQTMIQLLPQTLGTDKKTVIILDAMRKQRNIADYSGDIIPESTVVTCIAQAEALLNDFKKRLKINELPNKL